jgi:hypothetical protein
MLSALEKVGTPKKAYDKIRWTASADRPSAVPRGGQYPRKTAGQGRGSNGPRPWENCQEETLALQKQTLTRPFA